MRCTFYIIDAFYAQNTEYRAEIVFKRKEVAVKNLELFVSVIQVIVYSPWNVMKEREREKKTWSKISNTYKHQTPKTHMGETGAECNPVNELNESQCSERRERSEYISHREGMLCDIISYHIISFHFIAQHIAYEYRI